MSLTSILIPARNEEKNLPFTIGRIQKKLNPKGINYEILIVNDNSTDGTKKIVEELARTNPRIRMVDNPPPSGIGNAIKKGLNEFKGDHVIICMADASDSPQDMLEYIKALNEGFDCCFGSRWHKRARVIAYPKHKLFLNRLANLFIQVLFGLAYNDTTNAFKCYSRKTVQGLMPIWSHHFNITVELPLKAIARGYIFKIVPTNWYNRRKGSSSLKIQEMGSRYLYVVLCILFEKLLCQADYAKKEPAK